ncbi:unnamed protein product [Xylocopa violacea]|uniref:Uncharacterized protein n=1 Tax=Xylocopa violacea TaxID=135666 RepID=A0ABP1MZS9_XYLVO
MPNTQLTTSHSQPIYVPGKYSPSSCLSDKEEDEIYGFGYGVFSRQMLQQRQQKLALAAQNTTAVTAGGHQQAYQSCLSPRSALFYEFPPNDTSTNNRISNVEHFFRIAWNGVPRIVFRGTLAFHVRLLSVPQKIMKSRLK